MPEYNLMLGLSALAAYGVLLMANTQLQPFFNQIIQNKEYIQHEKKIIIIFMLVVFGTLNIVFFRVFQILVESEILNLSLPLLEKEAGTYVGIYALTIPVIFPQAYTMGKFVDEAFEDKSKVFWLIVTFIHVILAFLLFFGGVYKIYFSFIMLFSIIGMIIFFKKLSKIIKLKL